MAPVVNVFKKNTANYITVVAVTAQHRQMLDQVLNVFDIVADYDLDLMSTNQTLENLTREILNGISNLLALINPDLIFVQGDTTTTFATSLAAFYQKIPVGHIEAGLRTNNKYSPFPEEINRRMTSTIASYHFAPTKQAAQNLLSEGVEQDTIKITGNTVIDALLSISEKLDIELNEYETFFSSVHDIKLDESKMILVTGHRRESFGQGFENICNAIKQIAENNIVQLVYPVHLNPNVQEPVRRILGNIKNVHLIPPQDYIPFVFLMKKAHIILTDSGGIQEEVSSLGKPVLVMRDRTERPEGVAAGIARLVGTDPKKIISTVESLLNKQSDYDKMAQAGNPYGNGTASECIIDFINQRF